MLNNSSQILCRDAASRLTAMLASNGDRVNFIFDGGATLVEHYGYDQFNNRRIREPAGGPAYFHQYDDAHQLTAIRTGSDTGNEVAAFQYDDNGNLTQKSGGGVTRTFTYDALERLQQVDGSDISTETYA